MLQSDNMAIKGVLIDDRRVGKHTFERDSNNVLKMTLNLSLLDF